MKRHFYTLSVLVTRAGSEKLLCISAPDLSFVATMKAIEDLSPGWRFVESF